MPRHFTRVAIVAVLSFAVAVLAGCAGAPRALAPVPADGQITEIPADAALAARAMLARIRGLETPGVRFTPQAATSPDGHGFAYDGFEPANLRLHRYMVLDPDMANGAPGRDVNGVLALADDHGRGAELVFRLAYVLEGGALTVRQCTVGPLFAADPRIRVFLAPKGKLPGPAPDWAATFDAVRAVDATPKGGLRDAAMLDTHDLVLFVMDRTDPDGDVALRLDLEGMEGGEGLEGLAPTMRLSAREWVNYDGWRVAVVSIVRGKKT